MGTERSFTLVLGGGGMRGLAHVGVLEALTQATFLPAEVVGSSVGALVAAAWCTGMSTREMTDLAFELRRRDLFQIAHREMALKRMQSPGLYRPEPLHDFVSGLLGDLTFDELEHPLLVNTVDIDVGTQVFWGQPGLRDLRVADAVIASCALPGFFPPHPINGRYYADGAAAANLPVHPGATAGRDLVIAVDVGTRGRPGSNTQRGGFAAVYARATEIAIQRMDETVLRQWTRPPLVLIRPAVWHIPLLSFDHSAELLRAGFLAAHELTTPGALPEPDQTGVFPRHAFDVNIDEARCVGCGACVHLAPPGQFRMDTNGKAVVVNPTPSWSPIDGFCVAQCPTRAISAVRRPE